jgi:ethanolamine ammonia-lyase large subunit
MKEVEERGVDLATGHGEKIWDLNPKLAAKVNELYRDAKTSLWAELTPEFITTIPGVVPIRTLSRDRNDYIAHPNSGETLSPEAIAVLEGMRDSWGPVCPRARSSSPTA